MSDHLIIPNCSINDALKAALQNRCDNCIMRKHMAATYDMHISYGDCPFDCEVVQRAMEESEVTP